MPAARSGPGPVLVDGAEGCLGLLQQGGDLVQGGLAVGAVPLGRLQQRAATIDRRPEAAGQLALVASPTDPTVVSTSGGVNAGRQTSKALAASWCSCASRAPARSTTGPMALA